MTRKQLEMQTTTGFSRIDSLRTTTHAQLADAKYLLSMPLHKHSRVSNFSPPLFYSVLFIALFSRPLSPSFPPLKVSMTHERYLPRRARKGGAERAGETADLPGAVRSFQPARTSRHCHWPPSLGCFEIPTTPQPRAPL